jgi:uncharacterized protein
MTPANQPKADEGASSTPTARFQPSSRSKLYLKPIFFGPNGLRAGWRLLIFLAIVAIVLTSFVLVQSGGHPGFRNRYARLPQTTITPSFLYEPEVIAFLAFCVATLVMAKVEHRKFSEYGLPPRQALHKDFWIGAVLGFLALSGTLLTMFLFHGFRVTGLAIHGTTILSSLAGWGIAFLLSGLFEEFAFRGYVQYTLSSGIGFWPAAFLVSGLFGLGHLPNPNENAAGALSVVTFGLLLCFFLWRTGNLWCAVGFHLAWDWGQMFYGVPDSGIVPYHNLLNSTLSGPRWLSGGTVGPESSILTPIALLAVALIFSAYYRENRYRTAKSPSSSVKVS